MAKKKKQTPSQRYETLRLLHDPDDVPTGEDRYTHVWDPDHHPQHMVEWFKEKEKAIEQPERVETVHGQVSHVQAPIHPPTFAAYASEIGVSQECLLYWSKRHESFKDAYAECKSIAENCVVILGALGAYNAGVVQLMLKNLHGWADKVEAKHVGAVQLTFDEQDEDA